MEQDDHQLIFKHFSNVQIKSMIFLSKTKTQWLLLSRTLCVLLSCLSFFSANTYAQQAQTKRNISLEAEPLSDALKKVSDLYGYRLEYRQGTIPASAKVEKAQYDQVTVNQLLTTLLQPHPIDFQLNGNSILLIHAPNKRTTSPIRRPQYVVSGYVVDESKQRLAFATVELVEGGRSVITNDDGSFRFVVSEDRPYALSIKYMGFKDHRTEITPNVPSEVRVTANTYEMNGVEVAGMRRGEVKSLNAMKEAPTIQYVLSQEQIERFPDLTVGEALQRVPGVTMTYSYGLPQAVILRGLEAEDGSVTINGNRMPSTEPRFRIVDLNGILASTVERIEVIKTLTPDMEADGTAGTINIVTKNPPSQSRFFDVNISGGHNLMSGKPNYVAGLTWGQRQNKWGYVIGTNYSRTGRGEDRIKKSYGSTLGDEELYTLLKGIELEATDLDRQNIGMQGELNYFPTEKERFYLRGNYNGYVDENFQHNQNFNIKKYVSTDRAEDIAIAGDGWYRHQVRNSLMLSTGGQKFFNRLNLNYDVTYAMGYYNTGQNYRTLFEQTKLAGVISLDNPEAPQIQFDQGDVFQGELFTQRYLRDRKEKSRDKDLNVTFNASHPFRLFGSDEGLVKIGGRYRDKSNNRNRSEDEYKPLEPMLLTDFVTDFQRNDFFDGNYNLTLFPNARRIYDYHISNPGAFGLDEAGSIRNSVPDTYRGGEKLGAFYGMVDWKIDRFAVVAGARYERTTIDYEGANLRLGPKDVFINDSLIQSNNGFSGFLPSINARFAVNERSNIRMAITRSLSRPGYFDLVPWEEAREQNGNIKRGNPDLIQASSTNYDLLGEHYFSSVGLLSASAFYKTVKNKVYKEKIDQVGGEWDGWTIETPRNGKDAMVYGFELVWQQQFTFLPGFWNGFGVYANYTQLWSEMRTPNVNNGEKTMLPDARPSSGNVAFSYEKYGFSSRLATNFYGSFVSSIGDTPEQDRIERGRVQIDFSASQRIKNGLSIFVGLNNLNNAPISTGYRDGRPDNDRHYGTWGNIGVRYSRF